MLRCKKSFLVPLCNIALIAIFLLFNSTTAKATHVMGADLAWECIAPNQYRVNLAIYRDCNGINLSNSTSIRIQGCGSNFTSTLTLQATYPQDITPLCPSAPTACGGGSGQFGVEQWIYSGVITVPNGCNDYTLSWSLCCRNNAITTLAQNDPLYIEAHLDNTLAQCDNSPQFLNIPTAFFCNNQQTFYNPGGFDPDGDSLSYSLVDCEEAQGNSVDYANPFSGTNPLTTTAGTTIDPLTGAISFTPNGTQVGILCVLVEEFRNGVKIGETVRDLQFTIINCSNVLPDVTGIGNNGVFTQSYNVTSCFGQQFCFDVQGYDPNGNNIFMFWNGAIPGASFTTNQVAPDTIIGTFCWTPTLADVGQYSFTVTVQDDACPLLGQNTFTYLIDIIANPNPTVTALPDTAICAGESVLLQAVAGAPTAPTVVDSIVWSPATGLSSTTGATVTATPAVSTIYQTTIYYSDGCTTDDFVVVDVQDDPQVAIIPNGTNVCAGAVTTLTGTTDQTNVTFEWFDPDGVSLGTGTVSGTQTTIDVNVPALNDTTLCYELVVENNLTGCTTIEQGCLILGSPPTTPACINIYVSPTGDPAGSGTQFDPTTIEAALRRAACNNTVIKLAVGTYNIDTTAEITSFLTVEGGFDPTNLWRKTSQQGATTINRTNANPLGFPNAYHLIAFNANNAEGFRLQDLTITTDDADSLGMTTYGVRLTKCSDYNIVRCQISAGAAGDGSPGDPGIQDPNPNGSPGVDGAIGNVLQDNFAGGGSGGVGGGSSGIGFGGTATPSGSNPPSNPTVGDAGDSATAGSFAGGGGGAGGSGNVHSVTASNGQNGGGAGGGGVPPGVGGVPAGSQTAVPCSGPGGGGAGATAVGDGTDGAPGTNGANGADAGIGAPGTSCAFYLPGAQADAGQNGIGGTGGCGGGGGFATFPNTGGGGGGGGGGGVGGTGGDGGYGGGGSFGVYIHDNGANGNIEDCNIGANAAGIGGIGGLGSAGGAGGLGGAGGASGAGVGQPGAGGDGGDGGNGGTGGQGGTGSDGISIAVKYADCLPGVVLVNADSTFPLATQDIIFVENVNCTNATVQFTETTFPIPSTGLSWDFDVFTNEAIPANGSNNTDTTQYSSIGRYSISQGANMYTDFHNIAFSAAFQPTITSSANMIGPDTFQLCSGDFATFSSDFTADSIIWEFNGALPTNPSNVQNVPSSQFNTVGCFEVTVQLITDCCGDSPLDTVYLLVDPNPTPSAAAATVDICAGETTTLTINGLSPADTVIWAPTTNLTITGQGTADVNPNDTTVYVAQVYSIVTACGLTRLSCPAAVTFDVNVFPDIDPNMSSTDVICANDGTATSAPNFGSGDYNFVWSSGPTTNNAASSTITNLASGVYCVTITDNVTGCDTSACIFVNPATGSIVTGPDSTRDISCFGANDGFIRMVSSSGTGPYSYVWDDIGAGTDIRDNLPAGIYCVTATDALGCSAAICITISEPDPLDITVISVDTTPCEYDSIGRIEVEGFGGTGLYSYAWSSGQTTAIITGLPGDSTYTVTVTDANGCTATESINIPVLFPVTPQAVQTANILCNGDSTAVIRAGATDGIGGYAVDLYDAPGGTLIQTDTQAAGAGAPLVFFNNIPAGSYYIEVTDTNAGCFDTISITITEPPLLTASAVVDNDVSCNGGNDGAATVTAGGGTTPYTYLWDNGESTASATLLPAGVQCVTVTDDNFCSTVTCVTITEPTVHTVSSAVTSNYNGADVSCNGSCDGEVTATPAGGTAPYTYLWDDPGAQTTQIATGLCAGVYTVTTTDDNNCTATSTVTVTEPVAVTATLTSSINVSCFGGSDGEATAAGSGGTGATYTFLWDDPAAQTTATATGLTAGGSPYCASVTDINGCTDVVCVTITEPAAAHTVSASVSLSYNGADVSCNGACDGEVTAAPVGGTGPYTFQWDDPAGQTTAVATGLCAGVYNVTSTDFNSCTATATVTVTEPAAITATIDNQTDVSCNGGNDGTATVLGSGGTGGYAFNWDDPATQSTATATGLTAGTYCVTVTDANLCTGTVCVTITEPTVHTVSSAVTSNYNGADVSCNGSCDGEVTATPTGGVAPYTYLWDDPGAQTTQTATGLCAGVYTVTTTDFNSCTATSTVTVSEPTAVTATISSIIDVNCFGDSTGSATVVASGGTTPPAYTYNWTDGETTATITNKEQGTYFVTVTDGNGCIAITSATINEPASAVNVTTAVTSDFNGQDVSCNGATDGEATATASGGSGTLTYLWDGGASSQTTAVATGLGAGTYCVTVTDSLNCTAVSCVTVTEPTGVTATIANTTDVNCFGDSTGTATIAGNGGTPGYTFDWDNNANNQTTATATGLPNGSFCGTVTDLNGCAATVCASINQPATAVNVNINTINNVTCAGAGDGSVVAVGSGGSGTINYLWDTGSTNDTLTNLGAGVYCVTVTDSLNCTATACVTVTEPAPVVLNVLGTIDVNCFGQSTGEATVGATGGTAPYSYLWDNGATTAGIVGIPAGNYCVTATDANGCTATQCVTINEPGSAVNTTATVVSNYNGFDVSCFGASDGSATANVAGGTPPYNFQWDIVSQTTQTATGLADSTYCVFVTDDNGCRDTACVTLTEPTPVTATITGTVDVLCQGDATGTATAAGSGGVPGYTFDWDANTGNQTTATATGLSAPLSPYTVTVTDLNGCNASTTVIITEPASSVVAAAVVDSNVSCFGGSDGSATASGSGGTPGYTYQWDGATGGQITATASGLSAGSYCVTVTDNNGCTDVACVTITEPTLVVAGIASSNNVGCRGDSTGSATATVTGGTTPYTYLWDANANNQTTITATGLAAGSYNVTVSDANNCSSVAVVSITQPAGTVDVSAVVSSNFNGQDISCFGAADGEATATASDGTGPYTFVWSNSQTTGIATGLNSGTYCVTVIDANNCTDTACVTLFDPPVLTATASIDANVSCLGGSDGQASVTVVGGTAPYTYNWDNGSTVDSAANLSAGNQCVTVTDANGCADVVCVNITEPATAISAAITAQTNATCSGDNDGTATVSANGGTAPYTYEWDAAAINQLTATATGLGAGTYCVTTTDNNGCTDVACVTITAPSAVTVSILTQTNVICKDDSTGTAQAQGAGGTGPYTYTWSTTPNQTTATATGLAAGSYTVTVADVNGCSGTTGVTITEPAAALTLNIATTDISCNGGSDGVATANPAGGVGPYTYSWDYLSSTTQSITGLSDGSYCVTVSDNIGCQVISCVTLTEPSSVTATITAQTDALCNGGSDGTATVAGSGGTPAYTFLWDANAAGQTTATATGLSAANSPYSVTVTDNSGCEAVTTVIIGQPATAVTASAVVDNNLTCFGDTDGQATASATGGTGAYSYQWGVSANNQITATATGLPGGAHCVTVSDANGCESVACITITEPSEVTATISATTAASCSGGCDGTATVAGSGGTPGYTFLWDVNAASQTTATAINLCAGSYNVTVTDANGCSRVATAIVTAPSSVIAVNINITSNYNGAQISCSNLADATATANVTGGSGPGTYTFNWSAGPTTQSVTGLAAGPITVTVTDANGCVAVDIDTIIAPAPVVAGVNVTNQVSCFGGADGTATATTAGGTGGFTFVWDDAAASTTQTVNNLPAGPICVTITDANGCQDVACGNIIEPANALTATTTVLSDFNGEDVSCAGSTNGEVGVTASGGTSPYSYSWGGSNTADTLAGVGAGTYTVTVTDNNGCTVTSTVTVTEPSAVTATITASTDATCNGSNDGSATVAGSGGTAPTGYTFLWSDGQTTATAVGLVAGNYPVTVTDQNGCTGVTNVTINEPLTGVTPSIIVTSNYNGQEVSCAGACDGEATASAAGGTGPYTFQWDSQTGNQTTNIATGLCANTPYSVTVSDAVGCSSVDTIVLTEPTPVTGVASVNNNVSCNSGNDGSASVVASGGTAPYTYLWASGENTTTANQLSAGNQCVTITDANGCTGTACVSITEPATFLAVSVANDTLYNGQDISCQGASDAAFSVTASGGTPPYSYVWSNGPTTTTQTGVGPGVYYVSVSDAGGCTQVDSIEITEPALITAAIGSQTNVACFGDSTGSFTLTASGGTPGYTYDIGNGPVSSSTFNNLPDGSYTVTVSDLNFCETTVTVNITEPASALSATAAVTSNYNGADVSCFNACDGEATATPTGGTSPYSYVWTANGQTTQTATGLCGGNSYSVEVTDANGCTFNTTVTLSNPTQVTASLVSTVDVLCNGDSTGTATVSANGGTPGYTYTIGTSSQASATFTNLGVGNYVATVSDLNGCTATVPFIINGPPALVIDSIGVTSDYNGWDVSCNGACDGAATAVAIGGTGTYQFVWSNGQTSFTASGLCNGASVTVTDANGCTDTASVTLDEPPLLTVAITNQINIGCAGASTGSFEVTASGGNPNYTFDIGNGSPQATGVFTNLAAGNYCVTVSDINGCSDIICTTISASSPINLTTNVIQSNNGFCANSANGIAQVVATGGTAPYTYLWDDGQTSDIASFLGGGQHCVTVEDANLCSSVACVTITGPTPVGVAVTNTDDVSCFGGTDGSITVAGSGGTAPYVYSIDNGNTFTNQVTFNNLSGSVAGTVYSIIVRDNNGCEDTITATIFEPTQLQGVLVNETDVSCFGGNDGTVTVGANGGTAPYTYSFQGGAFTATDSFVNLIAGNYTIDIQDANGCLTSLLVTISQPPALVLNIDTQQDPLCNQSCDGQIIVSATGGTTTAAYQFSIDGVTYSTNNVFTGLCEGTYPVSVQDGQGCITTVNVTLTDPAPVAITVTQTQSVSCNGGADGEATAVASGGVGGFTYNWDNGQNTAIATGLTAGTYCVTATDGNGCSISSCVTITEPAALVANVTSQQDPLCAGDANGSYTVQADPATGTGPYTYDNGISGVQTSGVYTNQPAGTYNITVTDNNGCTTVETVVLTDPAAVTSSATVTSNHNGQDVSCNGACDGEATVTAAGGTVSGNYNYLWPTTAGSQQTVTATGLCAGTYIVTVTDDNGCQDTASVTVTEPLPLAVTTTTDSAGCNGGTSGQIVVTATDGTAPYSFVLNGTTTQIGATGTTFTNLAAGTYTIVTTDANGCSITSTAQVFQSSPININITQGTTISCAGDSTASVTATASNGVSPYTFTWSDGQVGATATGLPAGTYLVFVTDGSAGACPAVDSITITEPTAVDVIVVTTVDPTCGSGLDGSITVSASGGTPGYIYSTTGAPANATGNFTNLQAGTYTITATDNLGCTDTISVTLGGPGALTLDLDSTDVTCFGLDDGSAIANVSGGTPFPNGGYLYSWSNSATTQAIGNLAANTYTVIVQDANGCQISGSITVNGPLPIIVGTPVVTPATCGVANGTIDFPGLQGGTNGNFEVSFDNGVTFAPAGTALPQSGLAGGTYNIVIRDADSRSCEVPITVNVTDNGGLVIDDYENGQISCFGEEDGEVTVNVSGGTPPYSYNWSNGQTTATATGLAANFDPSTGTAIAPPYQLVITDANGCSTTSPLDVYVNTVDTLIATDSLLADVTCFDATDGIATVNVSGGNGGYSYFWANGDTTQVTSDLMADMTYGVIVTDMNGCTDTASVRTRTLDPITATLSTDSTSCFGISNGAIVVDDVSGGTPFLPDSSYLYGFDPAGPFSSDAVLNGLPAGIYTVYIQDSSGCVYTHPDSMIIYQPAPVTVTAYQDTLIRMGETVEILGSVNSTDIDSSAVTWTQVTQAGDSTVLCTGCFGLETDEIFETSEMIFSLNNGCGDADTITISVNQTPSVFVPNAFTPNGDGVNDVFTVYASVDVEQIDRLLIFDRWGELVYEVTDFAPNDPGAGWDGKFKGKDMNPGVFVYYIEYTKVDGTDGNTKGDVTLLR